MSHKRYYFVLILILSVSVLLLGMSYSSYSGNDNYEIDKETIEELTVLYSNGKVLKSGETTDIGITNLSDNNKAYKIFVKEVNVFDEDIYYEINGSEKKLLTDNTIIIDEISKYGTKGDYKLNTVTLYGTNSSVKFTIDVIEADTIDELKPIEAIEVQNDSE